MLLKHLATENIVNDDTTVICVRLSGIIRFSIPPWLLLRNLQGIYQRVGRLSM